MDISSNEAACTAEIARFDGVVQHDTRADDPTEKKLDVLDLIRRLARRDVHAERFWNGEEWGYRPVRCPLTDELLLGHVEGTVSPRGVYPLTPGSGHTQFSAFDLDDHNKEMAWQDVSSVARELVEEAARHGLVALRVRTGGGRGIHLWFQWDQPQPADEVRDLMLTILAAIGFVEGRKGVENSEIEIFPAQDSVAVGGYGNLIALPFARESKPLSNAFEDAPAPTMWVSSAPLKPSIDPVEAEEVSVIGAEDEIAATVNDALKHVDADDYGTWIRVAAALKRELPDHGLEVLVDWSSKSAKYKGPADVERLWMRCKVRRDGKIVTLGTIFHLARRGGWNGEIPHKGRVIRIIPGEIERIVNESEAALLAHGPGLYSHGDRVVTIARDRIKTSRGEAYDHRLHQVDASHVTERFSSAARYLKYNVFIKKMERVDPPKELARTYLARGQWQLPPIIGVIMAPILRADGSVLDTPGYDPATGLFYDPMGAAFPPIPTKPTEDDARKALELLKHPIRHFPFVEDQDRSVSLSGTMTAVLRRTIEVAPMHAYDAPAAGSGKSMLVDVSSVVGTGHEAAVAGQRSGKFGIEELDKQIAASLLGGTAILTLDNLTVALDSALLCQCLTQSRVKIRHFGRLSDSNVVNVTTFFCTANGLIVAGDLTRRTLLARLDPQMERPELRVFAEDPLTIVKRDRTQYVNAVLTIARAYLERSDNFKPEPPLGSYGDWSRMVRDPLMWLGEADPVLTMERIRADDPVKSALDELMAQWQSAVGLGTEVTVAEMVKKAQERNHFGDEELINEDLYQALKNVMKGGPVLDGQQLGSYLRRHENRVIGGRRFTRGEGKATGGKTKWILQSVNREPDRLI